MTNWIVLILGFPLLIAWLVQVSDYVLGFSLFAIWRWGRARLFSAAKRKNAQVSRRCATGARKSLRIFGASAQTQKGEEFVSIAEDAQSGVEHLRKAV